MTRLPRLAHLAPVSVGVEGKVADSDLTLVGICETTRAMNFRYSMRSTSFELSPYR
jgi:hypothetical protein